MERVSHKSKICVSLSHRSARLLLGSGGGVRTRIREWRTPDVFTHSSRLHGTHARGSVSETERELCRALMCRVHKCECAHPPTWTHTETQRRKPSRAGTGENHSPGITISSLMHRAFGRLPPPSPSPRFFLPASPLFASIRAAAVCGHVRPLHRRGKTESNNARTLTRRRSLLYACDGRF